MAAVTHTNGNGKTPWAIIVTLGLSLAGLAGAWVREALSADDRRISNLESELRQVTVNKERVEANTKQLLALDETLQREMRLINATTVEMINGLRAERVKASDDLDNRLQREMDLMVRGLAATVSANKELVLSLIAAMNGGQK